MARQDMIVPLNSPMNSKHQLTQAFTLTGIGLIAFYVVAHSSRFDQFRVVDIVLLLSTGLCFGVALSTLLRRRKD